MRPRLRKFLTPGWVGLTVFAWAVTAAMVLLGRWQLDVSNSKHFNLQNFGYALQWWIFSAFALLFWVKLVRDAWRGRAASDVPTSGQLVVRRGSGTPLAPVGPVDLIAPPNKSGAEPVIYRAYLAPQSSTPVRSHGDPMHDAYNDYLWQLSLADSAENREPGDQPGPSGPG